MESLVCRHWLEEDFYGGAMGGELAGGRGLNTNAGWQEGGLPASLIIKGGCDTLTQATNLPCRALPLRQPAGVTALLSLSLSDVAGA